MALHNHTHTEHDHKHKTNTGALKNALVMTAIFMFVEIIGGYLTHSLSLISDGIHMLTDATALAMSLGAFYMSRRPASHKRTFGFYRLEVLAAFANGMFLIVLSCVIMTQAWERLHNPAPIRALETMAIAFIGLLFNIYSAFVLLRADHTNFNIRGAFFHVMGDLFGSVGALTAGVLTFYFGFKEADALVSIFISVIVIISAWRLVSDTVHVMLEGAPAHLDVHEIESELRGMADIEEVHDLHVWCISSDIISLSAHVVSQNEDTHSLLLTIRELLKSKFDISHVTIQIEKESLKSTELPI